MHLMSWRIKGVILPILTAVCIICFWELSVRSGLVRSVFLPAPSSILYSLVGNIGYVATSAIVTLRDIAVGYIIGCSLGVVLGVVIGHYREIDKAFAPLLLLISPIPIVTFLPLFIIWFGLNIVPVLFCATIAAFFPSLMSTITGVKNVDHTLIEVAQNFGATKREVLKKVILPGAVPHIANGLRLSIQLCFLVTPVAEMIMGDIGLGGLIWKSADLFKTEMVIVGQLVLGLMGLTLYKTFDYIESNLLLRWKHAGK